MACWDAVGKHFGQPVSTFFGGALTPAFPSMYYIQAHDDLDAMVERGARPSQRGFNDDLLQGRPSRRSATSRLVLRMREAVGRGPKIRVDANEGWSPGTAVRILRRLAPGR